MSTEPDSAMEVDAGPSSATQAEDTGTLQVSATECECIWFDRQRGFGFLQLVQTPEVSSQMPIPPPNIFVHQSDIQMDAFRYLRVHQQVVCDITLLPDGRYRALSIHPVMPAEEQ